MACINIIIPAYNDYDLLPAALGSVLSQTVRNRVHVTIVDDASDDTEMADKIVKDFGNYLSVDVIYRDKNGGCGQARQTGIDACRDDYFMFLDCDDTLASPFALEALGDAAYSHNADMVTSQFAEEIPEEGRSESQSGAIYRGKGSVLRPHIRDCTWMHGKLYRTEFIQYHGIRFNESRSNEDSAFNTICYAYAGDVPYVEMCTYLWRYNSRSLTRREDWLGNTAGEFVRNSTYALSELIKRRANRAYIAENVYSYLCSFYGYAQIFHHQGRDPAYQEEYHSLIREWYHTIHAGDWIARVPEWKKAELYYANDVLRQLREAKKLLTMTIENFEAKIR